VVVPTLIKRTSKKAERDIGHMYMPIHSYTPMGQKKAMSTGWKQVRVKDVK
jgi:hypothetical protein